MHEASIIYPLVRERHIEPFNAVYNGIVAVVLDGGSLGDCHQHSMAMIEHESQFNPEIVSSTDDYGLMQINSINHEQLEEKYRTANMLDPYQNVYCGIKIIGSYIEKYTDYGNALMAYNMGEYGAKKAWENGVQSTSYITIKPGYYEGFTLDIENNFPVALDSWQDRRDANKEITEIKRFLIECAGLGLVECFPGWCTGYSDYNGTITAIRAAVKEMRDELRTIPTWTQYNRAC